MIVHLVMFKFKDGISKDHPRVQEVVAGMRALPPAVPEIRGWEIGFNFSTRPIAYDIGLYSTFDNEPDLQTYINHPQHQTLLTIWHEVCTWHVCDFPTDPATGA